MTLHYDLLALLAASCWAISSTLSVTPARHLGAIGYARWRMIVVSLLLWTGALGVYGAPSLTLAQAGPLIASAFFGIVIGDAAHYATMNRLGPRRAGILFATNALFSVLFGTLLLGERMTLQTLSGSALVLGGVMIAIAFGRRSGDDHAFEATHGRLRVGVLFGLAGAISQSIGTALAKPALAAGAIPLEASALRVSVAGLAYLVLAQVVPGIARDRLPINRRIFAQTALSGSIGMGLGMTLLLAALSLGDIGVVAVLSSVTPILLLPVLWMVLGRRPAPGAWLGAGLTVIGTALILSAR